MKTTRQKHRLGVVEMLRILDCTKAHFSAIPQRNNKNSKFHLGSCGLFLAIENFANNLT